MADFKEEFVSFWAHLRDNFGEDRINQMLDHLPGSLLEQLQNPFAKGYTSRYLAYRTVIGSMNHVCGTDISVIKHPRVGNEEQPGDQPVNTDGLKYLVESGHVREELLLDILEGGRNSVSRHRLATTLNPPKANPSFGTIASSSKVSGPAGTQTTNAMGSRTIPREPKAFRNNNARDISAKALWKGCDVDEIPIPSVVKVGQHLEPYLSKLQAIWMIHLGVDKERRVLIFRSQGKQSRHKIDDLSSDRHRQEFRFIFLSYIIYCLKFNESVDFMGFHCEHYKEETESWRKMAEGVVKDLKEKYVDKGVW
ncbi:hypothetical protein F5Y10DRAFT_264045 [Nemania abortiva]|nr:hypothetical protein F5Y10DRAFT_264045 [Nemania abortiva]